MKTRYRMSGITVLVLLLAMIRYFENFLFYDPLIEFFHSDYLHDMVPHFLTGKLLLNVALRYWLNTFISLVILYVAFMDKNIVKFSFFLYLFLFIGVFVTFLFLVLTLGNENFMALFYVRRFLIHPVFVIILLPAFYYYRLKTRQTNNIERFSQRT